MELDIEKYLKALKIRKHRKRFFSLLSVIVAIGTISALTLPAITQSKDLCCGYEEHTHSDGCYEILSELVCTYESDVELTKEESTAEETTVEESTTEESTSEELTAEQTAVEESTTMESTAEEPTTEQTTIEETATEETTAEISVQTVHTHTEECYVYEKNLLCAVTEHTHSDSCYSDTEEVTEAETENGHNHTETCYTADDILACTEWANIDPWGLDRESDEFRESAVNYVTYLINQLPDIDEFEDKLDRLDAAEDYDSYEEYYKEVYDIASKAWVNYENLALDLRESVPNKEALLEYEWLYSRRSAYATTGTRTVEFVNYYDKASTYKTLLVHSMSVGQASDFRFRYWYAVVVDENEYGDLIVTAMYDYSLTDKSNLKPTTDSGFVLLSHSTAFTCSVGDEATVNFDYLNTSAGRNLNSYGTVTFSTYVPPVVESDPVTEDVDFVINEPSDEQVRYAGAITTSGDNNVKISKTIDGTDLENVFDITLTVQTKTNVQTFLSEPDMAVVVVMDISNTMNQTYNDTTRYDAAVAAAETFIEQFASKTAGLSQIGFVAFNTHAHEIFELQPCSTDTQTSALISEMKADTEYIIDNYSSGDITRFTNVEGGLKMGYDMLRQSNNANKYIIFLSDGFPTTYLVDNSDENMTNYSGYNPYTPSGTPGVDGVFYDYVMGVHCDYGTSYSDKASIRAREMATKIKNSGGKIFSIGIDVGGQTVQKYVDDSENECISFSTVDRTSTTYEIGDASSKEAYKTWLGNSIGSGYYYDSTQKDDITNAFNDIFTEIIELNGQNEKTVWTATDPLPILDEGTSTVEFIHFYDINDSAAQVLEGSFAEGGENTANHEAGIIYWDLKKSGYSTSVDPDDENTTYYYYSVTYRVRLQNESSSFAEYNAYETNGDAYLEYRTIVTTNGVQEISDTKTLDFPKPMVEGYLSEFTFTKQNNMGSTLEGARFILSHSKSCDICRGDGTTVTTVPDYTAVSDSEGTVAFTGIPSGHTYILTETVAPDGYLKGDSTYGVVVAYDVLTVTEYLSDGTSKEWTGEGDVIINYGHILPETGGTGTYYLYIIGGLLTALSSVYLLCLYIKDRERRRKSSSR